METTKDIENLMRQAILFPDNPLFAATRNVISRCLLYWKTHDHLNHDDKSKIFSFLYLKTETFSLSEKQKSEELNVSEKSLERYRDDFVKTFLFYANAWPRANAFPYPNPILSKIISSARSFFSNKR